MQIDKTDIDSVVIADLIFCYDKLMKLTRMSTKSNGKHTVDSNTESSSPRSCYVPFMESIYGIMPAS
jgi:hypothetical protein